MKGILLYIAYVLLLAVMIFLVLQKGKTFEPVTKSVVSEYVIHPTKPVEIDPDRSIFSQLKNNLKYPLSLLLTQIILILALSRILSETATRFKQPAVIGEIIAGIVLGPSIFGLLFPKSFDFIFPKDSIIYLHFLSQIGLAIFMFIIGMEVDYAIIKKKMRSAIFISNMSVMFTFLLGMIVALFIYRTFAPAGVSFLPFSLFIAIALCITAFPVLVRIIQDRNLTHTPLGLTVITCAATDDITAWSLLAIIVVIAKASNIYSALLTILLAFSYVMLMLVMVRPFIEKVSHKLLSRHLKDKITITIALVILLVSAYISEIIGLQALFGAFLAGTIMPRNSRLKDMFVSKIGDFSAIVLLPIFFAYTGLRTQFGLLTTWSMWGFCLLIILVAVMGKFGGATISARITGQSWRDSFSIGALLNTRGLMELIVLNMGYDLGILSPEIFAIMCLMALLTTMMTGPALNFINFINSSKVTVPEGGSPAG
jgi:Kef-type K+ transport system membrane component KefB